MLELIGDDDEWGPFIEVSNWNWHLQVTMVIFLYAWFILVGWMQAPNGKRVQVTTGSNAANNISNWRSRSRPRPFSGSILLMGSTPVPPQVLDISMGVPPLATAVSLYSVASK